jgi:hypothetical protein
MAKTRVLIVHDQKTGKIISISRPSKAAKVVVLSGGGQSVFETEVEEDSIVRLTDGSHKVDVTKQSLIAG